jgi:hypothetical protein
MCADGINGKPPQKRLNCCNQVQIGFNSLSLLQNPAATHTAIFAPVMRFLWVSQMYRQYIAPSVKYIDSSRLRESR